MTPDKLDAKFAKRDDNKRKDNEARQRQQEKEDAASAHAAKIKQRLGQVVGDFLTFIGTAVPEEGGAERRAEVEVKLSSANYAALGGVGIRSAVISALIGNEVVNRNDLAEAEGARVKFLFRPAGHNMSTVNLDDDSEYFGPTSATQHANSESRYLEEDKLNTVERIVRDQATTADETLGMLRDALGNGLNNPLAVRFASATAAEVVDQP